MKSQYSAEFNNLSKTNYSTIGRDNLVSVSQQKLLLLISLAHPFLLIGRHLQVLSVAASGYHRVLDENRKLYNQVQDLKGDLLQFLNMTRVVFSTDFLLICPLLGNIRVYCRVRPFLPGQLSGATTIGRVDDGSITIITPPKYGKESRRVFNFNKVFGPSASQG